MNEHNDPGQLLYQNADSGPDALEPDTYLVDKNQDSLPPLTVGMYRAFLAKGRAGIHALMVYLHLLFTYRLQDTDHVYATNSYLQRGLGMGEKIVERAKALLKQMGHIEMVKRKDVATGRIIKTYTKLNFLPNPGPAESTPALSADMDKSPHPHFSTPVEIDPKCLKKKKKMLEETTRDRAGSTYPHNFESWWNIYPRKKEKMAAFGKWKAAIRSGASEEQLLTAARNYAGECDKEGRQEKYIKHAATFLGPTEPWKEYLAAPRLGLLRVCPHCGKEQEHTGAECLSCWKPLNPKVAANG